MPSANEQQNPPASAHSQGLAAGIFALAGAFESNNANSVDKAQLTLIKTLLAEKKIGAQRVEKKKEDDVIGGLSKMGFVEAEDIKETKKSAENGIRRRVIVSRGIMAGGCVVS